MYRVFIDLDGVVCDFIRGVCSHHRMRNPYNHAANRGDRAWDIMQYANVSQKRFWSSLKRPFWAGLKRTPEADRIVKTVEDGAGESNVCFLTSPCMTLGCMDGKRDWCTKYYPHIPILFSQSVAGQLPPKHFIAGPNSILIDDHTANVREWIKYGGIGFLWPRPWNQAWKDETALERLQRLFEYPEEVERYRGAFVGLGV